MYVRLLLIRTIIVLKHVVDVDVLIVKILLKLVFLQVIVPKSLSKCVIQQVANLRMLFIWLNVNVVTCNTLVKQINKFPNVWIVIDLISIITKIKAMLLMLLCISFHIHIHLMISDLFLSILSIMRWIVFVRKLTGFIIYDWQKFQASLIDHFWLAVILQTVCKRLFFCWNVFIPDSDRMNENCQMCKTFFSGYMIKYGLLKGNSPSPFPSILKVTCTQNNCAFLSERKVQRIRRNIKPVKA